MIRAVLIALFALAACGDTAADPRPAIVLWHTYTGAEKAALEAAIAATNRDQQAFSIEPVFVPYEAFADKITNAIPNGNGPDLFIFAHDRIGDWAESALVEPIEFYVDEKLADRFAYAAVSAMAYEGSLFGLPMAVKSVALFYRTDLCPEPPATTEALFRWGEKFIADHPGAYALAYDNIDLYGHAPWLHGFGGHIFSEDHTLDIATPEAARAAAFARRLRTAKLVPASAGGDVIGTLFNAKKTALAISGPWFIAGIEADVPWQIAPLPMVSETDRRAAPFLGVEGVLMSSRSKHKRLAFFAMRALTSDASATRRAGTARQIVPNHAAYEHAEIAADPVLAAFRAQLDHTVAMPKTPAMRMVWTPYETALGRIIQGGDDPAAALARAEDEIRGYLHRGTR